MTEQSWFWVEGGAWSASRGKARSRHGMCGATTQSWFCPVVLSGVLGGVRFAFKGRGGVDRDGEGDGAARGQCKTSGGTLHGNAGTMPATRSNKQQVRKCGEPKTKKQKTHPLANPLFPYMYLAVPYQWHW